MASNAKPAALASKRVGSCVVLVHGDAQVTADGWQDFLDTCKSVTEPKVRVLIDTPGVGPTARQRAQSAIAVEGIDSLCAVLTDARVARGIIMATSWTGVKIKGFPSTDIQRAMDYLGVPKAERRAVENTLAQLKREVGR